MLSKTCISQRLSVFLFVAAIVVTGVVGVKVASPDQQDNQDDQSVILPDQQPTFRVGVTLITTDVIVRDGNGQFIADLLENDFQVLEDGVPQDVASLVLVHGGRVYNQLDAPPLIQEGIIVPQQRPTNDAAGRVFAILIDDFNIRSSRTAQLKRVFKEIGDTLIHEGDLFGIVSTGLSSIAVDMTYDRSLLEVAENKIMGGGMTPTEIIMDLGGSRGPTELLYRAHVAFQTAYDLVRNLERVENRRKAVIYVSNGYDFNPFAHSRTGVQEFKPLQNVIEDMMEGEESYQSSPFETIINPNTAFNDVELNIELVELARAANRANASFYTLDPRGLVAGGDISDNLPIREWDEYIVQTQDSLRVLAELTGGIAVVNRNNFRAALQEIDAQTSDYYVLGYYTNNPDPTIRTRDIEIVVNREDVDVSHRERYSLPFASAR